MKNIILIALIGILFASCETYRSEVRFTETGEHVIIHRSSSVESFSDTVVVRRLYRESFDRPSYQLFGSYVGVIPKDTMVNNFVSNFYITYHKAVLLK